MSNTMANKCLLCNKDISDKAKYCSDRCRKAFSRNPDKQVGQIQPGQIKEPEQMTSDKQPGQVVIGKCHGCNRDVPEYVCICYECFRNGITHKSLNIDICQ